MQSCRKRLVSLTETFHRSDVVYDRRPRAGSLTLRSFRQLELSLTSSVRNDQAMRSMAALGAFVIGSAGLGWSGLSGRRVGDSGAAAIAAP